MPGAENFTTDTNPGCKVMRVAALATRWGCKVGVINSMVAAGEVPAFRIGTLTRIPIAAVVALEAACEEPVSTPPEKTPVDVIRAHVNALTALLIDKGMFTRAQFDAIVAPEVDLAVAPRVARIIRSRKRPEADGRQHL